MKLKSPNWFKWEPYGYWTLQGLTAIVAAWTLWTALVAEVHLTVVINAGLSGVNVAGFFHNWLHRRRDQTVRRMFKTMNEQQQLLREICAMKSHEVARQIAERMGAEIVSIQGPDGPIDPSPTRH